MQFTFREEFRLQREVIQIAIEIQDSLRLVRVQELKNILGGYIPAQGLVVWDQDMKLKRGFL